MPSEMWHVDGKAVKGVGNSIAGAFIVFLLVL